MHEMPRRHAAMARVRWPGAALRFDATGGMTRFVNRHLLNPVARQWLVDRMGLLASIQHRGRRSGVPLPYGHLDDVAVLEMLDADTRQRTKFYTEMWWRC